MIGFDENLTTPEVINLLNEEVQEQFQEQFTDTPLNPSRKLLRGKYIPVVNNAEHYKFNPGFYFSRMLQVYTSYKESIHPYQFKSTSRRENNLNVCVPIESLARNLILDRALVYENLMVCAIMTYYRDHPIPGVRMDFFHEEFFVSVPNYNECSGQSTYRQLQPDLVVMPYIYSVKDLVRFKKTMRIKGPTGLIIEKKADKKKRRVIEGGRKYLSLDELQFEEKYGKIPIVIKVFSHIFGENNLNSANENELVFKASSFLRRLEYSFGPSMIGIEPYRNALDQIINDIAFNKDPMFHNPMKQMHDISNLLVQYLLVESTRPETHDDLNLKNLKLKLIQKQIEDTFGQFEKAFPINIKKDTGVKSEVLL